MNLETIMDRWFLKCAACKKPWAVELPRVKRVVGGMGNGPVRVIVDESAIDKLARGDGYRSPIWDRATQTYRYPNFKPCPLCGNSDDRKPHKVMGRVRQDGRIYDIGVRPPCDGRCTEAKGPCCDCECGGKNHGTGRLVECVLSSEKAPKV